MRKFKKRRKGISHIPSKKTVVAGYTFDSKDEAAYYIYLTEHPDVKDIEVHPVFILLEKFMIRCEKCRGSGKIPSPKTKRLIKCKKCSGEGTYSREGAIYTADFTVIYKDGYKETIDVKGGWTNERFPMTRKLWENKYGEKLIVVKKEDGIWKRS